MVVKKAKMADLINYRMRVTTNDGRQLIGQMLAFDQFMNLVLADTQEFRVTKRSAQARKQSGSGQGAGVGVEERRTLGLVILRGEHIVSLSVEALPPSDDGSKLGNLAPGPGIARAVARGMAPMEGFSSAPSLAGPVRTQGGMGVPPGYKGV